MDVTPVKKHRTYQLIYNRVRELIASGDLKPGEKLPPERGLATTLEVSRTSLREALRMLELYGIIEVRAGEGAFIRELDESTIIEELGTVINKADDSLILDVLEVRQIIERECTALAAKRATALDLEDISKAINKMSSVDEDVSLAGDLGFHYAVAKASHNSVLYNLMKVLGSRMKESVRYTRQIRTLKSSQVEVSRNEHVNIFLAISGKDSDLAWKLADELFIRIRAEMANNLLKPED